MNSNENNFKKFGNNLDKLKSLIQKPRICVSNYFTDLRIQVDLSYSTKETEIDENNRDALNDNWLEIIKKIMFYEKECLNRLKINHDILHDSNKKIELFEKKIMENKAIIDESINDEINFIEKKLFLNKTFIFLDETSCENLNLLYKMNKNKTAGKLIIVKDQYINQTQVNLLKNNRLKNEFSNEAQKYKELVKFLKNDSNGDHIVEININLKEINEIDLKMQYLKSIDYDILNDFDNLKKIDISWNFLSSINSKIFYSLVQLISIDLSWNSLKFIELNLFNGLVNLESISLNNNKLTKIPNGLFCGLKNVNYLNLANNHLIEIENKAFNGLSNLTHLYLNDNFIKKLDSKLFQGLNQLETIDLSRNSLKIIKTSAFKNLDQLKLINFEQNNMKISSFLKLKYMQIIQVVSLKPFDFKIEIKT